MNSEAHVEVSIEAGASYSHKNSRTLQFRVENVSFISLFLP